MKITHVINRNVFNEYLPSQTALNLVLEKDRFIKAEDQLWEEQHPPRLTELCIRVIVANFERNIILNELPCTDKNFLLEILPTNLPLPLVVQHLQDGIYWKRMVMDRWKDRANYVEDHGFNWKRMYMERHVQELVESFSPEGYDAEEVAEMCDLASDFVYKLDLRQLKMVQPPFADDEDEVSISPKCFDHIELGPIISGLKNLMELHIQFGIRDIASNYKKELFEISNEDCRSIGEGVTAATNLRVLRIHQSKLDDDKLITLLSKMAGNKSLSKLEFSNCQIGDAGAIAISKYIRERKNIHELNLYNNKIGEAGIEALSYVLTQPDTSEIRDLNLRFNAFGVAGLRFLASALIREPIKIERLNISCCNLNEEAGILLAEMLKRNTTLKELYLSNNHFGEKVGRAMEAGMEVNKGITTLDLRMTDIPNENLLKIGWFLHLNRIRARKGEKGVERELRLMEKRQQEERQAEVEEGRVAGEVLEAGKEQLEKYEIPEGPSEEQEND